MGTRFLPPRLTRQGGQAMACTSIVLSCGRRFLLGPTGSTGGALRARSAEGGLQRNSGGLCGSAAWGEPGGRRQQQGGVPGAAGELEAGMAVPAPRLCCFSARARPGSATSGRFPSYLGATSVGVSDAHDVSH